MKNKAKLDLGKILIEAESSGFLFIDADTCQPKLSYSFHAPKKPPFIVRTNDAEIIKRIEKLLIRIGGWENAKFLLENLRLNEDSK